MIADCGFMNLFNSGLKIEIECFINPQSAIRNPQSSIRNPQSAIILPLLFMLSSLCSPPSHRVQIAQRQEDADRGRRDVEDDRRGVDHALRESLMMLED